MFTVYFFMIITVKPVLSDTVQSRILCQWKIYADPLYFTIPTTGSTQPCGSQFWVAAADKYHIISQPSLMLFDCGHNVFTYLAFLFSAEMKKMYHVCKYSSPDIQESLYVTYNFSDPIHRSVKHKRGS